MRIEKIAILHYSAPPIVGGVESVIQAHAHLLITAGYQVTVIAGEGASDAFSRGVEFVRIPELNTQNPAIARASLELENGRIPKNFNELTKQIEIQLKPVLRAIDRVIVHNIFTKHFNLPLTAALSNLLDQGELNGCIAWCHDFTWTSSNSRSKVFPGYPWELLRKQRPDMQYVTVSESRRHELAGLYNCPIEDIQVIYNGVDPKELLGLSQPGQMLIERLDLWAADLILLMPVRVTQAKNIELATRLAAALKDKAIRVKIILTGPPDPHDQENMVYFQSLLRLRHELGVESEMCFVYESGPDTHQPYVVSMQVVGDLYRVSDALFMPSHREGFGMPILEAGLVGLPVFSSMIPAAAEIGGSEVVPFQAEDDPDDVAALVLSRLKSNTSWRLRRRIRQNFIWNSIFDQKIQPLIEKGLQ